jgi:hypothetical protein
MRYRGQMDESSRLTPRGNTDVTPTVTIDGMRLMLPAGYTGRASAIARQVASELSRMPLARAGRIAAISLPAMTVQPGETDAALAMRIARAVHAEIGRRLVGPGMSTGAAAGARNTAGNTAGSRGSRG